MVSGRESGVGQEGALERGKGFCVALKGLPVVMVSVSTRRTGVYGPVASSKTLTRPDVRLPKIGTSQRGL